MTIPEPSDRRLPGRWTADRPVRIYARVEEGAAPVGVRGIRVTRPPFDPCGHADRPLRRILAATDTGPVICALAAAGAERDTAAAALDILRSVDCGATFERVGHIEMSELAPLVPLAPLALVSSAALALSPDRSELALAIGLPRERRAALNSHAAVLVGSLSPDDCRALRIEASGLDLGTVPSLDPDRGPRETALGVGYIASASRRLGFVDRDADLAAFCVGDIDAWDCAPSFLRRMPGIRELDGLLGMGVLDLGTDVLVTARRYTGELDTLILEPEGPPLVAPLVVGAGPAGAFDARGVGFPTLMQFRPDSMCEGHGLLFVGGLSAEAADTEIRTEALPFEFVLPAPR